MRIEIRENHFLLLPQRAVLWEEKETLLIGDLHLGKITHFRKAGIAVPPRAIDDNFLRLNNLLSETGATRIIFLGDLFHSAYNAEWEMFRAWRTAHDYIDMVVVLGNHDVLPLSLFLEADLEVFNDDFEEDGFVFTHHPREVPDADRFVFAGHIHPVFTTYGKGRQSVRLPCFIVDGHQAILPSFGVFTGGFQMGLIEGRKIYIATEKRVFPVG